ncbi:homeobox protein Hox-D4 isoform X4 [Alligator sinensis]|uniref:Homeobox protein Hox-D4 isoform X4 n=1 Tax=Alligator sinensis TaxID=38654 RepID=A0A3Q0GDT0_ALLSI|nr:homeobox protein Hox-D4 isoform X4 [Alligator sinensis]
MALYLPSLCCILLEEPTPLGHDARAGDQNQHPAGLCPNPACLPPCSRWCLPSMVTPRRDVKGIPSQEHISYLPFLKRRIQPPARLSRPVLLTRATVLTDFPILKPSSDRLLIGAQLASCKGLTQWKDGYSSPQRIIHRNPKILQKELKSKFKKKHKSVSHSLSMLVLSREKSPSG